MPFGATTRCSMPPISTFKLLRRIRFWTGFMMVGLMMSGLTAIPIQTQFDWGVRWLGEDFAGRGMVPGFVAEWLREANRGVQATTRQAPFVYYGTDWLAFGHIAIALAFVGAWREPVRNRWLFQFGMLACGLVIPWAMVFGHVRGIPFWWRLIDSSFGVVGFLPMWFCHRWARELESEAVETKTATAPDAAAV